MTGGERRMGLGELTDVIAPERVVGLPVGEVTGLAYDSRAVAPGTLFFAVPGDHVDGHDFVAEAARSGAAAVVAEHEVAGVTIPQLIVERTRNALADAADAWFEHPSERLRVIGITGTDGKTTTAFLANEVLRANGRRPGMVGTVAVLVGDQQQPNRERNTTPEAPELQALLARMVAAGNDSVIMEATSHGLAQARTRGVRFDAGVLTNLTSEHLDFHGSLERYRAAKAMLFEEAPLAILNADDPSLPFFRERARDRVVTYALETDADVRASDLRADAGGTTFRATAGGWSGSVRVPMPGAFNVPNALAVIALAHAEELDLEAAAAAIGASTGVPGRMETVDAGQPFAVVVDYAHTEDSLRKVLRVLRPLATGRLIAVFGSAGERDPTKRAPMGRVAAEEADVVVVTDEDPRLEEGHAINEQIAGGARAAGAQDGERLFVIDDRSAAITHAMKMAGPGDVILLAGKGHERSIIYADGSRPWDEKQAARDALRAAGYHRAGGATDG